MAPEEQTLRAMLRIAKTAEWTGERPADWLRVADHITEPLDVSSLPGRVEFKAAVHFWGQPGLNFIASMGVRGSDGNYRGEPIVHRFGLYEEGEHALWFKIDVPVESAGDYEAVLRAGPLEDVDARGQNAMIELVAAPFSVRLI